MYNNEMGSSGQNFENKSHSIKSLEEQDLNTGDETMDLGPNQDDTDSQNLSRIAELEETLRKNTQCQGSLQVKVKDLQEKLVEFEKAIEKHEEKERLSLEKEQQLLLVNNNLLSKLEELNKHHKMDKTEIDDGEEDFEEDIDAKNFFEDKISICDDNINCFNDRNRTGDKDLEMKLSKKVNDFKVVDAQLQDLLENKDKLVKIKQEKDDEIKKLKEDLKECELLNEESNLKIKETVDQYENRINEIEDNFEVKSKQMEQSLIELEKQKKDYSETIVLYKDKLEVLEQERIIDRSNLKEYEVTVQELKNNLQKVSQESYLRIQELENERIESEDKKNFFENEVCILKKKLVEAEDDIKKWKYQSEISRDSNIENLRKIVELEDNNALLSAQHLEEVNNLNNKHKETVKLEWEKNEETIHLMEFQIKLLDSQNVEMEASVKKLLQEQEESVINRAELQKDLDDLKNTLIESEANVRMLEPLKNENSILTNEYKDLAQEMEKLYEEIDHNNFEFQIKMKNLEDTVKGLEGKLIQAESNCKQYLDMNEEAKKLFVVQIKDKTLKIEELESKQVELSVEKDKLEKQNDNLTQSLNEAMVDLRRKESEAKATSVINNENLRKLEDLESRHSILTNEYKVEVEKLNRQYEEMADNNLELKKEMKNLEESSVAGKNMLEMKIVNLELKHSDSMNCAEKYLNTIFKLEGDLVEAKKNYDHQKGTNEEANALLTLQIKEFELEKLNMMSRIEELENKEVELTRDKAEYENNIDILTNELIVAKEQMKRIEEDYKVSNDNNSENLQKLKDIEMKNSQLTSHYEQLNKLQEESVKIINNYEAKVKYLEEVNALAAKNFETKIIYLEGKYSEATKSCQRYQITVNDLEEKQEEIRERFKQYKVENVKATNILTLKIKELEDEKLEGIHNLKQYQDKIGELDILAQTHRNTIVMVSGAAVIVMVAACWSML